METIDQIPITKIQRATKIVKTGAKVGVNYIKYYGNRITQEEEEAKKTLNNANADDIYDGLKNLKGSALKVAQMLSMEKSIMPAAYVEKFSLSQFSVPPLSPALVNKTFRKYFGKSAHEIFDKFDATSVNAASIGQVHQAEKEGKKIAVKIQYPGVAGSISSDLSLIKPIAIRMFNIKGKDSDKYFKEVEEKLIDETNYILEVDQSIEIAKACKHIPNMKFPEYYKEYSTDRIISMEWMNGLHLTEFAAQNSDPVLANKIGQALWDFYMYQIHVLRKMHADPHPGNFLVSKEEDLIALDFGCMKSLPDEFYYPYFTLSEKENINNKSLFEKKLYELEILRSDDSKKELDFFKEVFYDLLSLFTQPFHTDYFDFSNKTFFDALSNMAQEFAQKTELRKYNGNRGSKHFIYVNRTFFGLYNLMHTLKATHIEIKSPLALKKIA
ncbi:AarF/UbiB family protein [Cyclobacteriaceae bacterium]|jgi:predicted unusual protein kinase regulating ubiquinone biosynthesis (AarF/ABC1/UbiB family)|nr:AarF/UbiB family protein [Cyclobacteriaceae bacterium]MDB4291416.1 AarF/UbiB family protein [Cyclobacteriaceae bacterium]|tara:strand:+ start:1521 stop:2843 length:1323 start_codon:yes stop_codon:yes gene_type:complete